MKTKDETITNLVRELQAGNFEAFTELYNLTHTDIEMVCRGILKNPDDAEDAVQDTYLRIYRSFSHQGVSPIKDSEKFLPWAKTIARNTSLNQFNRQKRKTGLNVPLETETRAEDRLDYKEQEDYDADFSPEQQTENEFIRKCLEESLSGLPEMRRLCLTLHQQGMKTREISEQLSIPEGTVKSHIRYAKKALEKSITEIEEREHVQLHGLVWLSINGTLKPYFNVDHPGTAGWITADAQIPKQTNAARSPKKPHGWPTVVKTILGVVIAAGIIAGVVIWIVSSQKAVDISSSTRAATTVSTVAGSSANRRLNPSSSRSNTSRAATNNAATAGNRNAHRQNETPAQQQAEPTTRAAQAASTTRRLNGPIIFE